MIHNIVAISTHLKHSHEVATFTPINHNNKCENSNLTFLWKWLLKDLLYSSELLSALEFNS